MHVAEIDKGMLGANGIVGGGFGLAIVQVFQLSIKVKTMLPYASLVMVPQMKAHSTKV